MNRSIRHFLWLCTILAAAILMAACIENRAARQPAITLEPSSGGSSTPVTVTGSGFPPRTQVSIRLGPPDVGASAQSYADAIVDADGSFRIAFAMPERWPDGSPITDRDLIVIALNEDATVKATTPFEFESTAGAAAGEVEAPLLSGVPEPPKEPSECPVPGADTQLLANDLHGYCLLYPLAYDIELPNENETVIVGRSLLDVTFPKVFIEVQDAAGRTARQAGDELVAELQAALPGMPIQYTPDMSLGGEAAVMLDQVPGQDVSRQVLAVYRDRLYKLTFVPANEDAGEVYEKMESLYAVVIDSWRFLSRQE